MAGFLDRLNGNCILILWARHQIPTAGYATFTDPHAAHQYVDRHNYPLVIKADGLAAGKGVIIAHSAKQAHSTIDNILQTKCFGEAGTCIVIEEFLQGEEASFICCVHGSQVLPLATSQDHKAIGEGDTGANTGGMGAYSPAPLITDTLHQRIMHTIIHPTVQGLQREGIHYVGFLYCGLMINEHGEPKVLEYNCRLGDPETQPLLMRLRSDLVDLILATINGTLAQHVLQWDERTALGVVMAAPGYPGDYPRGDIITSLPKDNASCKIFHSGTQWSDNQQLITQGGRVLCVTALGNDIGKAQQQAYRAVTQVEVAWPQAYYRRDIGNKAKTRMEKPEIQGNTCDDL